MGYERGLGKSVDWSIVVCYLLLVFIGWINIYAAVHATDTASIFDLGTRAGKQFMWMMISFGVDIAILFMLNPKVWELAAPPGYVLVLLLLVLVIFVSKDVKGSHSWFELGPVKFQPAEVSKITTSLMLATIMGRQGFRLKNQRNFLSVAAIVGIPMLAILGESETGSMLVYVGYIFVLYREGMSGWWIALMGLAILLFILTLITEWWISAAFLVVAVSIYLLSRRTKLKRMSKAHRQSILLSSIGVIIAGLLMIFATNFIFENVLQDHQRKRIEVLLGLKEDPSGVGYNVRQSMIAIGSGGAFGKGFLNGTQTTFGFVPEQATDFIFCTIGEEWGFMGCLTVIFIFCYMIIRILNDADRSRSGFTRIYGYCVAACLFMHLFINIGMTIGLMPVIGIPLPMISYGGSSLLAFSLLIFIFVALDRQEKKYF